MTQVAIDIFTDICKYAVPIAVVFELGNLIISSLLNMAFGGRLCFTRK